MKRNKKYAINRNLNKDLSIIGIAKRTGVSPQQAKDWLDAGLMKWYRDDRLGFQRVTPECLEEFIKKYIE